MSLVVLFVCGFVFFVCCILWCLLSLTQVMFVCCCWLWREKISFFDMNIAGVFFLLFYCCNVLFLNKNLSTHLF